MKHLSYLLVALLGCAKPDSGKFEGVWQTGLDINQLSDTVYFYESLEDLNKDVSKKYLVQTDSGDYYHYVSKGKIDSTERVFAKHHIEITLTSSSRAELRYETFENYPGQDLELSFPENLFDPVELKGHSGRIIYNFPEDSIKEFYVPIHLEDENTLKIGTQTYTRYERKKN